MTMSELMRNTSRRRRMLATAAAPSLISALPHVAEAAHGPDPHAGGLDLGPQPRHMDLDRVRRKMLLEREEAFGDLLLAQHTAGAREEQLEQRPLARGQVHRLVV